MKDIFSIYFLENVHNILLGREVVHRSYSTGRIVGYAHDFWNQKVRENKNQINVIAHNLFGFDFFRSLGNSKFISWWYKSNEYRYCEHSEKVKIIDTVKYYQQSLSTLTAIMTETEREKIKIQSKKFIPSNKKLSWIVLSCTHEEQEWC